MGDAGGDAGAVVYVVDDDISVREALEALVAEAGWQPQTFETAQAFLACRRPPVPSCLVLDVSLPDLNGLELQQQIAAGSDALPIIFITGYGDVPTSVRAMKAGAIEFLTKPFGDETLLDTIRDGLERSGAALTEGAHERALRERHAALSTREREVMALVVTGLMNKQVAGKLGISEITVKAHRGRVMRKMGVRTLANLVKVAGRLDIAADT